MAYFDPVGDDADPAETAVMDLAAAAAEDPPDAVAVGPAAAGRSLGPRLREALTVGRPIAEG